jgi:peptide/histidine transporter 3/4
MLFVYLAATFGFENMATLALAVNLVTYFNGVMHMELADAANQLTNYMGTSYILSIVAAVLADTYIGRFKAVLIAGCFEFSVYI